MITCWKVAVIVARARSVCAAGGPSRRSSIVTIAAWAVLPAIASTVAATHNARVFFIVVAPRVGQIVILPLRHAEPDLLLGLLRASNGCVNNSVRLSTVDCDVNHIRLPTQTLCRNTFFFDCGEN